MKSECVLWSNCVDCHELLGFYGGYLGLYAEKMGLHKQLKPILKDYELVLLYNLLAHYGLGFPTLSRILMAMREARFKISPKTRYVTCKWRKRSDASETVETRLALPPFNGDCTGFQRSTRTGNFCYLGRYCNTCLTNGRRSGQAVRHCMTSYLKF